MSSFTANQERAIQARGNALVMAGAGTGKTRTMVERCIRWLAEPGNSLDHTLMVTFTDAAAAEMRHRIRTELVRRQESDPSLSERLGEQLALLDSANISTLHSFCFQLIRQHFYDLSVDPQITVLPEAEAALLAAETLDAIFQRHYSAMTPEAEAVRQLVQDHSRGWDAPIRKLVLRLHAHRQTLPNPAQWQQEQETRFNAPEPAQWREWLRDCLPSWSQEWSATLRRQPPENANAHAAARLLDALAEEQAGNLAKSGSILEEIIALDAEWPPRKKTLFRKPIEAFFTEAEFLSSLLPGTAPAKGAADPLAEDWGWTRGTLLTLLRLADEFAQAFGEAKRELGAVDFQDLEQLSLRLLWDSASQGPTALAGEWRARLKQVFVDECQDINPAQDCILRALGREGLEANRFLVGDVKQSIYRFRLADPRIFQSYAARWKQDAAAGQVIPLQENFRSHEAILQFVNAVFTRVMQPELGGVGYDRDACLLPGNPKERPHATHAGDAILFAEAGRAIPPRVEARLVLSGGRNEEEEGGVGELRRSEREARIVGMRLREMRASSHLIWDEIEKRHRAADWRDMVVLTRSPAGNVESYAKEFARLGIPLHAARGGFFGCVEVMDLLAIFSILDNPLQDVPLLTALRSPLAGLSLNDLALARLASGGRMWQALNQFAQREPSSMPAIAGVTPEAIQQAAEKARSFLRQYARWRRLIRETSLSGCLEAILNETRYLSYLASLPRGEQARLNVDRLFQWTRQFDQFHRQGLYRFLRFIEAQREAEIDHEPAPPPDTNAVRLMSIHQSKGLEFPVVALADLGRAFNFSDMRGDIILDEEYGICPQIKPPQTEQRYPSLPYWLARRRQKAEALGEEMRLLYVAMTRARDTLILAGTASRKSAEERWPSASALELRSLSSARCALDWLGPCLAEDLPANWIADGEGRSESVCWAIFEENDARLAIEEEAKDADLSGAGAPPSEDDLRQLQEKIGWKYPFAGATGEAAKISVSALRRRFAEEPMESLPFRGSSPDPSAPARRRKKLSAAEVGSAHHRFLQHFALDRARSAAALEAEAARLGKESLLTAEERKSLDFPALAQFWNSPVGLKILGQSRLVHRELAFTARVALSRLREIVSAPDARVIPESTLSPLDDEYAILEGVADLAVILPEEIWLLDFKTDQFSAHDLELKKRLYQPQLQAYAFALSGIYARPVTERWLHFLSLPQTVAC